jgi:hypothetical protein
LTHQNKSANIELQYHPLSLPAGKGLGIGVGQFINNKIDGERITLEMKLALQNTKIQSPKLTLPQNGFVEKGLFRIKGFHKTNRIYLP